MLESFRFSGRKIISASGSGTIDLSTYSSQMTNSFDFYFEFWHNLGWEIQVPSSSGCYLTTTSNTFSLYFDNTGLKIKFQNSSPVTVSNYTFRPNNWRNYAINLSSISGNVMNLYIDFNQAATFSTITNFSGGISQINFNENLTGVNFISNTNMLCSGMRRNLKIYFKNANSISINTLKYFNYM